MAEELPAELWGVVVAFEPLTLALTLSMTCKRFRKSLFKINKYNNYKFMDACAKDGYLSLLQHAFQNGSSLDVFTVEAAILAKHRSVAFWAAEVVRILILLYVFITSPIIMCAICGKFRFVI